MKYAKITYVWLIVAMCLHFFSCCKSHNDACVRSAEIEKDTFHIKTVALDYDFSFDCLDYFLPPHLVADSNANATLPNPVRPTLLRVTNGKISKHAKTHEGDSVKSKSKQEMIETQDKVPRWENVIIVFLSIILIFVVVCIFVDRDKKLSRRK